MAIAKVWLAWLAFEKPLRENNPEYLVMLYNTVTKISGERKRALAAEGQVITWPEARNRILTFEFLDMMTKRFGKTHKDIHADVSKVSSHNSWISRLNREGEYSIFGDVVREIAACSPIRQPVVVAPVSPVLVLMAIQVRRHSVEADGNLRKAEREFLGDEPRVPRTQDFEFARGMGKHSAFDTNPARKSRRGKRWRYEER